MLKLGETGVSALYLGDAKIKKVYLGSELVFEEKKPSRLPAGYTEVEYIYPADYRATLNTGQTLGTYNVETVIAYSSIPGGTLVEKYKIFEARRVASSRYYVVQVFAYYAKVANLSIANANTSFSDYSNSVGPKVKPVAGQRYTVKYIYSSSTGGAKVDVDGTSSSIASYSTAPSSAGTVILGPGGSKATYIRYYSFRIVSSSGNYMVDLVPCIDPSGIVGMYDLRNNIFKGPVSASYKWLAGPAV